MPLRPFEFIGMQGLEKVKHIDLRYLWLQAVVRGKQVDLKKVQSEMNMADLGTKVLEKDKIDRCVDSTNEF